MDYRNKNILAPMVRIGTLPARLLALDYGADLVYTEEIIDYKMLQCSRKKNDVLETIDFVWNDGTVVFRTCQKEKGKVVFQMGTCNAARALKVAKLIEDDVAAIDINMGCPKEFSLKGGMGAALLTQPEKIKDILTTLVQGVKIPVTCKIRILPTVEETVTLAKLIETTGVAALGVHGRMKEERSRNPNHNNYIKAVADALAIPVIANGGSRDQIKEYKDLETFKEKCGVTSVMVARAAQWNMSVFRKEGLLPMDEVVKAYLKYSVEYFPIVQNTKYNVQQIYHHDLETPVGKKLMAAATVEEICCLWDMGEMYNETMARLEEKRLRLEGNRLTKKRKLDDGSDMYEMNFRYNRKEYPNTTSPKMILDQWLRDQGKQKPIYDTKQNPDDKLFFSVVTVEGAKYASTNWEKSKRTAEQAAAVVCLTCYGIDDGRQKKQTFDFSSNQVDHNDIMANIPNCEHSKSCEPSKTDNPNLNVKELVKPDTRISTENDISGKSKSEKSSVKGQETEKMSENHESELSELSKVEKLQEIQENANANSKDSSSSGKASCTAVGTTNKSVNGES